MKKRIFISAILVATVSLVLLQRSNNKIRDQLILENVEALSSNEKNDKGIKLVYCWPKEGNYGEERYICPPNTKTYFKPEYGGETVYECESNTSKGSLWGKIGFCYIKNK